MLVGREQYPLESKASCFPLFPFLMLSYANRTDVTGINLLIKFWQERLPSLFSMNAETFDWYLLFLSPKSQSLNTKSGMIKVFVLFLSEVPGDKQNKRSGGTPKRIF